MSKSPSADAKATEYRSIPIVALLSVATLLVGYQIYLCYQWARELNSLSQGKRHSPQLVLSLSVLTLGVAAVVYECIFAYEVEGYFRERNRPDALPHFALWVATLNAIAFLCGITGIGIIVAIPCGVAATCLVQAELNKLASRVVAEA